jgi:cytochrome c
MTPPSRRHAPRTAQRPAAAARSGRTPISGSLVGHGGPVKAIAVEIPGGRVLTGSFDYAMMAWDIARGETRPLKRFDEHGGAINAVAFVPGGRLALAAGDDGVLTVWDLQRAALACRLRGHTAKIVGLAVTADGRWAASASWDRTVRLWDLVAFEAGAVLSGHRGPVNAVAFSADGARVYSASADGTIGSWTRADGSFLRPLLTHGWGITALARLPGSERLVFGSLNGAAAVLDAETGEVLELPAHQRPVLAVAVLESPGRLATGGGDGVIKLLRSADGALLEEYRNPYGPVWALAFLADGTGLYYAGLDDFVALWRTTPGAAMPPIESPFPRRFQVRRSGGGQVAAGALQFARKCSVCHSLQPDEHNRAGPTLHKLFGRAIGSLEGYPYSEALRRMDIVWTPQTLSKLFELGPDVFTPGSKMPLQRMGDVAQREALIAYIKAASEVGSARPSIDDPGVSASESPREGETP